MMLLKGVQKQFFFPVGWAALTVVVYFIYISQSPLSEHSLPIPLSLESSVENSLQYLIHTPVCTIPDIDPDHPSIVRHRAKNPKKLICSEHSPITEDSGLVLYFYKERIPQHGIKNEMYECYYKPAKRKTLQPGKYNKMCDKSWELKEKVLITQPRTHISEDGIIVTCISLRANSTPFYENVHFFIQPERIRKKREMFKAKYGNRNKEQLSVIIMGTDAVARGNLRRHMPKTFSYLKNHLHAVDLQGFNKIGDNTDPNVGAYLMGLSIDELKKHECTKKIKSRYDECPLIWKDYAKNDYATAYAEDAPWMATFHFSKVGFCQEPTDYYNRPYFQASDKIIGHSNGYKGHDAKVCQGVRSSISLIHDYSLKVAEALRDVPYFAYYWTASVTHEYLQAPILVDEASLQYLKKLENEGYLEHSVLFFVSDHGLRWGSFRATYAGRLEERMPYIMMVFPRWFMQKYSRVESNLRTNQRRLTASYDIHATLHDILNKAYIDTGTRSTVMAPHRGLSLFNEIPKNRTCEQAGIPEHHCACEHMSEVDRKDPHLENAAKAAISNINKSLKRFPDCFQLELDKVSQGRVGTASNATTPRKLDTLTKSYLVIFVTKPGGAKMESTLKYHGGEYELIGEVSRINKYGNQSHCISDFVLRKYCYCKDML